MGYTLEAALLDSSAAKFHHNMPTHSLPHGITLIPLTDEVLDEHFGPSGPGTLGTLWKLNAALEAFLVEASRSGRVVYMEADFFGGIGIQQAAVWEEGRLVLGPEHSNGVGAINRALRRLGVPCPAGRDEFDELGLGRFRHTADWTDGGLSDG